MATRVEALGIEASDREQPPSKARGGGDGAAGQPQTATQPAAHCVRRRTRRGRRRAPVPDDGLSRRDVGRQSDAPRDRGTPLLPQHRGAARRARCRLRWGPARGNRCRRDRLGGAGRGRLHLLCRGFCRGRWRWRGPSGRAGGGLGRTGSGRPQLLRPAQLPRRGGPVSGASRWCASRARRRHPLAERQCRTQSHLERQVGTTGLRHQRRQPGGPRSLRLLRRTARGPAGHRHRALPRGPWRYPRICGRGRGGH